MPSTHVCADCGDEVDDVNPPACVAPFDAGSCSEYGLVRIEEATG